MTAEALQASTPPTERDAGWRDIAAVLGARALTRLRKITAAIRPLAWVLMSLAIVFWVLGQIAGWAEFTVAAVVIAIAVTLCALFLIGRTAYDVSLDLARTRVVVGERAVGALTLPRVPFKRFACRSIVSWRCCKRCWTKCTAGSSRAVGWWW